MKVNFDTDQVMYWDSLIHLYNDWYMQYFVNATYPRLIVRFEDMLLYPREMMDVIANCLGTTTVPYNQFRYEIGKAKSHGSGTTFVEALLKSGNKKRRYDRLTNNDIQHTIQNLNSTLFIHEMKYTMPNLSTISTAM